MKRLFWRIACPFVLLAHRFGASYKWVNVVRSAWTTADQGYGKLWHHRWFGDAIDSIPNRVVLCGIGYRVAVSEGLVVFNCDDGMSATRIAFARDPYDAYGFLWYVEINGPCPACHMEAAHSWVTAVFGGSHEIKKAPLRESLA